MPEHVHPAASEKLLSVPGSAGARRSSAAMGTFMLRRARYFSETGRDGSHIGESSGDLFANQEQQGPREPFPFFKCKE